MSITRILAAALALALATQSAGAATIERYTSFFAFGDSLTDNGNLFAATGGAVPASPPYFDGRFSNGPVWAEAVAQGFARAGLAAANFAFGGAGAMENADLVPDLPTQLGIFGANVPAAVYGARPLAALWFGANDVFDAVDAMLPVGAVVATARGAAQAVAAGAMALASPVAGIRDFVIFNIPDLGRLPAYALFDPELAAAATAGSLAFNLQLDAQIDALRLAGLNVIRIDIAGLFDDLLSDPAAFGVQNATLPCVIPGVSICTPQQAGALAFWDPVHPTATIHNVIAGTVLASVAPVPLPLPATLLGAGLLVLAVAARRRA